MFDPHRNNLDLSVSPYLHQHADNPVHWQEWSGEVLDYARREGKPLLVSVGYSTCHWCHVMAREAFSDNECARLLNEYFVPIKVDREQRPDVDQFMMNILVEMNGQGGWPLNVFLSAELAPLFSLTYAPVHSRGGGWGFIDILLKVQEYHAGHARQLTPFRMKSSSPFTVSEDRTVESAWHAFDLVHAGFGQGPQFPAHCTLLNLLYRQDDDPRRLMMLDRTLEAMARGGLHDHLQGGFFRYCVDRPWTVPHFEKMLYDQAMLLWVYSLAWRVFGRELYRSAARGILRCLRETFASDGLFLAAYDADTHHEEGITYLWTYDELKRVLSAEEFKRFEEIYAVTREGNFEGGNHLVLRRAGESAGVEERLLALRRQRPQPAADGKRLTSWNALAGIGLVQAARFLDEPGCLAEARELALELISGHFDGAKVVRFSLGNALGSEAFLEDAAALFLLLTFLHEETGDFKQEMLRLREVVLGFRTAAGWVESREDDLGEIPAGAFDHPTPSSSGLAELALARCDFLCGLDLPASGDYFPPVYHDFMNLSVLLKRGEFHVIKSASVLPWNKLPANTLQVRSAGPGSDCYRGICRLLTI